MEFVGKENGLSEERSFQFREEECRAKILDHLRKSSLHNTSATFQEHKAVAIRMLSPTPLLRHHHHHIIIIIIIAIWIVTQEAMAEEADVQCQFVDEEEWAKWTEQDKAQQERKRQRTDAGGGGGGGGGGGASRSSGLGGVVGGGPLGGGGGGRGGNRPMAIGAPAPAISMEGGGGGAIVVADDLVTLPRSLIETMLDHVERATLAAQGAVSLSQQARNAFEDEHRRLVQISQQLRSAVHGGRFS